MYNHYPKDKVSLIRSPVEDRGCIQLGEKWIFQYLCEGFVYVYGHGEVNYSQMKVYMQAISPLRLHGYQNYLPFELPGNYIVASFAGVFCI
jgi:hypothetical protein